MKGPWLVNKCIIRKYIAEFQPEEHADHVVSQ